MAEITATMVKELRDKTQAGMMDCKKALSENDGDMDAAVKYLREKGLSAAAKRADRAASQGVIAIKKNDNAVAIFELNAETDFVARNEQFVALSDQLLDHVLAKKPVDMAEMNDQLFVGDESKKISDLVTEAIAVIGENIVANRFACYEKSDNVIADYIHMNGSIGVLVEISGGVDEVLAKDIAMHIAAAGPSYLSSADVPAEVIDAEKEVFKQQALNEGKPEQILDKIAEGKLNKFYKENCLMEQEFVKDTDKTIKQLLPEGASIVRFDRFQLGA